MKVGDIVRVWKQPRDLPAQIIGNVGFIEEMVVDRARLQCFRRDGSISGGGCIPIECLALEESPKWLEGKRLFDDRMRKSQNASERFSERLYAKEVELANRFGITSKDVNVIHSEIQSMWSDYQEEGCNGLGR